ncbi:MAG: hypothetical protein AB1515_02900 [Nitrospirota bacterium]
MTLDGGPAQSVNLSSPLARAQQIVYSVSGLPNTSHTLRITTTSSGTINNPINGLIDAFEITGALTENVACAYTNGAHVHAVSDCGAETMSYGPTGNLTQYVQSGVTQTYAWDAQNRLSSATVNGVLTTFVYDGDGGRVKKLVRGPDWGQVEVAPIPWTLG